MNITISLSEASTRRLGRTLGKSLTKGILCLYGNLGSGKTTFVKGLAEGLGIRSRIQSPTFTYQRVHPGRKKLYHFDCYRMIQPEQVFLTELREIGERDDGIIAIEWSENIREFLMQFFQKNRTDIFFEYIDETTRKISMNKTFYDRSTSNSHN